MYHPLYLPFEGKINRHLSNSCEKCYTYNVNIIRPVPVTFRFQFILLILFLLLILHKKHSKNACYIYLPQRTASFKRKPKRIFTGVGGICSTCKAAIKRCSLFPLFRRPTIKNFQNMLINEFTLFSRR